MPAARPMPPPCSGFAVRAARALILLGAVAPAIAAVSDKDTFDNWTVACEAGSDGEEQCFIFQNLVLREGGQRVLHVAVGYVPDHTGPVALFTLPLGISLPPGVKMQIDDAEPIRFPVERCEPNGCRAGLKLEGALLEAFEQGTEIKVTFHDAGRQPVSVPLSLQGFSAGLRALQGD